MVDYDTWARDLMSRTPVFQEHDRHASAAKCLAWVTEVEALLVGILPTGDSALSSFIRAREQVENRFNLNHPSLAGAQTQVAINTFKLIVDMLSKGRMSSLVEEIRAESVSEIVDQAQTLLDLGYRAAATVLAGGALEAHLLHTCNRVGATWLEHGSISKYNSALGQARKAGAKVYDVNDGKLVEAWGGFRNEAAHDPGRFARSASEVQQMVLGVREFLARNRLEA